ncbi:hypothetical protein CLOSTASPAR_02597 [[Clostridium] asparagiforme DSM 15981]|uniref:Uncharacterized protein n=1 Tax=[Clostridium] asparagiforme DSM 15981 TaxID=518636 RepID=C0D016_9FIRM|nr:hypothetical protein CLOSTASPAR_02597 [[Clostridium] asparagiforme DSM 15981]
MALSPERALRRGIGKTTAQALSLPPPCSLSLGRGAPSLTPCSAPSPG